MAGGRTGHGTKLCNYKTGHDMKACESVFPAASSHPFRIIAFDWDGTAVKNRKADARQVARVLEGLLDYQIFIVVITGTNFANINRQFASLIRTPNKHNLFVCTNRGSEVFGFASARKPILIHGREARPEENALLDQVAEAVKRDIENQSNVKVNIIYKRLNRRKIDLIPEWKDPEKSQIGVLLHATNTRLLEGGFKRGIKGVYELTEKYAQAFGLTDARITSDVKHIEIGLTDKSDSIRWVINNLAASRNIPIADILVLGDEFGPVAGFEGSDYRMVLPEDSGMTYVSVGKEPGGVPRRVLRASGGPRCFLSIMREQLALQGKLAPTEDEAFLFSEKGFDPLRQREIEALMAVGNGYLGIRSSLEEGGRASEPAMMVAGVYDRPSPDLPEDIVIFPDWLFTRVEANGERLFITEHNFIEHQRILDMKKGIFRRIWRHRGAGGNTTWIIYTHFACLFEPHALVFRILLIPENYRGKIKVETGLKNFPTRKDFIHTINKHPNEAGSGSYEKGKTTHTDISMVEAYVTRATEGFIQPDRRTRSRESELLDEWQWESEPGQEMTISKFACIYTSRDGIKLERKSELTLDKLEEAGVDNLMLEQADAWESRWNDSKVTLAGDREGQKLINFATYHLIAAGNSRDDRVSIGARTLTGPGYRGHIFWDSEVYMLPFFVFTDPPTARAMLMYRYHTLPGARRKAKAGGWEGALYAWESTITGDEMTPLVGIGPRGKKTPILSGQLEQHISADVAYGVWFYWNATLDDEFLLKAGAEILVETARFWASRVEEKAGGLCITNVEGPDEYHECIDNNAFTNMMAAWNLRRAADVLVYIQAFHAPQWPAFRSRMNLSDAEKDRWHEIAGKIIGGTRNDGLIEQFEGYFDLEDINVFDYEPRMAALDVVLGRKKTQISQAVKQADAVLLLYLLEEQFDPDVIRKNLLYYDARTAHGSSLSPSIYGLVAARMGLMKMALRYFRQAGLIDLSGNPAISAGGVHAAAMGGFWQQLVMGFGGVRTRRDGIVFYPQLPSRWRRMDFSVKWRGKRLDLDIRRSKTILLDIEGTGPVRAGIYGKPLQNLECGRRYVSEWSEGTWDKFSEYK
ncbi:MAG: hypothetical protein A2Y75_07735 [Candidatus Solincola sediminis]|uniref:Glycoside hydrolase family 65 n=1 Tax=Candidatus Solincola sediminis TaxID=1797199 RepID=A0A1F2WKC7_9ACTN|nr:MAG: hypothetical protein A2Y75_07735 [Candidatus Solincola sediminis]